MKLFVVGALLAVSCFASDKPELTTRQISFNVPSTSDGRTAGTGSYLQAIASNLPAECVAAKVTITYQQNGQIRTGVAVSGITSRGTIYVLMAVPNIPAVIISTVLEPLISGPESYTY